MDTDLDDLATALYVTCDDLLQSHPERVAAAPPGGFTARISDAEVLTLAVMQALLGHTSERRWLRYARSHLLGMFPTLPGQSGYNKRLRALAPTMAWLTRILATMTTWVMTACGWPTPRQWNAAAPVRPRSARTWPGGPSTVTAPRTPGSSGACDCTC